MHVQHMRCNLTFSVPNVVTVICFSVRLRTERVFGVSNTHPDSPVCPTAGDTPPGDQPCNICLPVTNFKGNSILYLYDLVNPISDLPLSVTIWRDNEGSLEECIANTTQIRSRSWVLSP